MPQPHSLPNSELIVNVPFAAKAAAALVQALLSSDSLERQKCLTTALGDSPVFLEWLLARLRACGSVNDELAFDDIPTVVNWLSPRLLTELQSFIVSVSSKTEAAVMLSRLIEKLLRLRELEANFAKTLEREKLDALKEFAYGASHEINNPLANISTRAQTLLRDEKDPERRRKLATINSQAFRAHEMISDLMLFARPPQPRLAPVNVAAIVATVLQELSAEALGREITLQLEAAPTDLAATLDGDQLAVALKAVCLNAIQAVGHGGRVSISLQLVPAPERTEDKLEWFELSVHDNGPGISPEVRRHIFDPFYSGREAGRGLGFGLPKCWRIVTQHGGRVEVESEVGEGTTVRMFLPRECTG